MNVTTEGGSQSLTLLVTVSSPLTLHGVSQSSFWLDCGLSSHGESLSRDPNPLLTGVGSCGRRMLYTHFCPFSGAQGGTEASPVIGLEGSSSTRPPQQLGRRLACLWWDAGGAKPCEAESSGQPRRRGLSTSHRRMDGGEDLPNSPYPSWDS